MKKYRIHANMLFTVMLSFGVTACTTIEDVFDSSLDFARQTQSGDSYENKLSTDERVGFNVGLLLLFKVTKPNTTSFLQPDDGYKRSQVAYAGRPTALSKLNWRKYRFRPSAVASSTSGEFLDHLGVLTGLEFVQKNSKDEDAKITLNYLQVPVLGIYTHELGDDRAVFGGLGPYFAYGVGGKIKGNGFSERAFDKDLGFKRFDAGLTFTAGYRFNTRWSVRLAYDLGLANLEQDSFDKTKNKSFSINLGYSPKLIGKLIGK